MSIISGDPNKNLFEQNPEIEFISGIKDFIKDIGSREEASKFLWAVYMVDDPKSKLYKIMNEEERMADVAKNYLQKEDFDWNLLSEIRKEYIKISLTKEEKFFTIWGQKIEELQIWLKQTSIIENTDQVVKIMKEIPKLVEGYEKVKNEMLAEKRKGRLRGGGKESLSESGAI